MNKESFKLRNLFIVHFMLCFSLFITEYANGQDGLHSDTISYPDVFFKAKLLTTMSFGVTDSTLILNEILSQKTELIDVINDNLLFIKVTKGQKFYTPSRFGYTNYSTGLYSCTYYLAYSMRNARFYKLGGFDGLSIDIFFDDLYKQTDDLVEYSRLMISETNNKGLDYECLLSYYHLSKKERLNQPFNCYDSCEREIDLFSE